MQKRQKAHESFLALEELIISMETDGSVLGQCLDRLNYTLGYKTHCGEERDLAASFYRS